jgi:hypothetical protein
LQKVKRLDAPMSETSVFQLALSPEAKPKLNLDAATASSGAGPNPKKKAKAKPKAKADTRAVLAHRMNPDGTIRDTRLVDDILHFCCFAIEKVQPSAFSCNRYWDSRTCN